MGNYPKGSKNKQTKMVEETITKKNVRCGHCRKGMPVGSKSITFVFVADPAQVRVRFCSNDCREDSENARFNNLEA